MAQRLEIDPHGTYEERWGWRTPEKYVFEPKKGLSREVVEEISWMKSEPEWMRKFRLKAFDRWERRPVPKWGADLSGIDFNDIYYFLRASEKSERSWDDVPEDIKNTFQRLGIPEAEQKYLGGVSRPVRVRVASTTRSRNRSPSSASSSPTWTPPCASTRRSSRSTSRRSSRSTTTSSRR